MGYNTFTEVQSSTTESMYNLMAVPFMKVGSDKGFMLSDFNFPNQICNGRANQADQILLWVWKEDEQQMNYETWYKAKKADPWKLIGDTTATFEGMHPQGLEAGTVFWYKSYKKSALDTFTCSGEVLEDAHKTVTVLRDSYNFVSYPYPVAFDITDENQVNWGNQICNGRSNQADQLLIWAKQEDGSYNYETWYKAKKEESWKLIGDSQATFASKHPNGLPAGSGFWFKAYKKAGVTTNDITFYSPINSDKND